MLVTDFSCLLKEKFHSERDWYFLEVAHQFIKSGVILLTAFSIAVNVRKASA